MPFCFKIIKLGFKLNFLSYTSGITHEGFAHTVDFSMILYTASQRLGFA